MLEKFKRKKQLPNQDRQIPQTIQELIKRYDLDNTDIIKYLDEIIPQIFTIDGGEVNGNIILNNAHFLKGKDENNNLISLIRAYQNMTAIGDHTKEARIWSNVIPTINVDDTVYTIATREQNVLWRDTGGAYMYGSQSANLNQKISEQNSGIVLVFQPYRNGSPQPWGFYTYFFPKKFLEIFGEGYGQSIIIPDNDYGVQAGKYLYFYDNHIQGNNKNSSTTTMFNTTIDNRNVVLTAVIGV